MHFAKVRQPESRRRVAKYRPGAGDKIMSCHTRKRYEIQDVGLMYPEEVPTTCLRPGQVGYIACNMKESSEGLYTFFLVLLEFYPIFIPTFSPYW